MARPLQVCRRSQGLAMWLAGVAHPKLLPAQGFVLESLASVEGLLRTAAACALCRLLTAAGLVV